MKYPKNDIVDWLMEDADPSILYQVSRDLLNGPESTTRKYRDAIAKKGCGRALLDQRNENGHWGNGAYNPKWTCTHYVLSELLQLGIAPTNKECQESTLLLLQNPFGIDGGINYAKTVEYSDVCINGMLLSLGSYFKRDPENISPIVEFLLKVQMKDGGWNCEYLHNAVHSSLHTTISVLEGVTHYLKNGYTYKGVELENAKQRGIEFILKHEIYKSEKTGETIKDEFFKFSFPIRWKYDILRCLDYFREDCVDHDKRMGPALAIVEGAKNKEGKWKAYSQPGKTYFSVESNGAPSRWNTLRALRVLRYYISGYAEYSKT